MISIKKYLETDEQRAAAAEPVTDGLEPASVECYRALLAAIGRAAVQISTGLGADLDANLHGLERRLSQEPSPEAFRQTERHVELQLDEWGGRTADYVKAQTGVVRELLAAFAKTAEAVGNRDQGYSRQFSELTDRLEKTADLEDLTRIRLSLAKRVSELKNSVQQMARESQQLVAQLRTEVSDCEAKLKAVENLALKDDLTGLANRRSVEERIRRNIAGHQGFSIVMLDLNNFKQVNDEYGHLVGDDLLRQFAMELKANVRPSDLVGRWGGDEFMVVLSCGGQAATAHINRIKQWVFGKYTVRGPGADPLVITMDASIGEAEWHPGESMQHLIGEADSAMYMDKKNLRQKGT
jgi:diguanylate cyclase